MASKTILGFAIICILIHTSNSLSCSKIVQIESTEVMNYLGNVTFTVPTDFKGKWSLVLRTQTAFTFFGGWGIRVKTDSTLKLVKIKSADEVDLFSGDQLSFRFRLYWAVNSTIPLVNNIVWEDHEICTKSGKFFGNNSASKIHENSVHKYKY